MPLDGTRGRDGAGPGGGGREGGPELATRTVSASGRSFAVAVLRFANGDFISVSEGEGRLGQMVASLAGAGPAPVTATVIPSKTDALFLRLVAERASSASGGIAVVSSSVRAGLGAEAAKALMSEIAEMVRRGA